MRTLVVALVGTALLVAGAVVLLNAGIGTGGADFGWFAYTPLGPDASDVEWDMSGGIVLLSTDRAVLGAALAALGLATVAALAGFRAGRRTARPEAD